MKSKLGVFSNANALLVAFALSHSDLITAHSINPESFRILNKDGDELFALMNTSDCSESKTGVGFPFLHELENKKVEVIFLIPGGDTKSIRYNAATIVQNLEIVAKQIKTALSVMDKVAESISILGFADEDTEEEGTE